MIGAMTSVRGLADPRNVYLLLINSASDVPPQVSNAAPIKHFVAPCLMAHRLSHWQSIRNSVAVVVVSTRCDQDRSYGPASRVSEIRWKLSTVVTLTIDEGSDWLACTTTRPEIGASITGLY
jgi:hypothetical protein